MTQEVWYTIKQPNQTKPTNAVCASSMKDYLQRLIDHSENNMWVFAQPLHNS